TQKTTTPVLLDPNGGFTVKVAAAVTDRLTIAITGVNGIQTAVPLERFSQTNTDGSLSAAVSAAVGRVEGPGGIAVDVPAGAFPNGAVVTLKPIAESDFPVQLDQLGAQAKQLIAFSGGVSLDLGGQTPQHYLNVFVPAAAGDKADDQ